MPPTFTEFSASLMNTFHSPDYATMVVALVGHSKSPIRRLIRQFAAVVAVLTGDFWHKPGESPHA
jgi:hypothetical protein